MASRVIALSSVLLLSSTQAEETSYYQSLSYSFSNDLSYSYSNMITDYSQSFASSCDYTGCSTEVLTAFGNQDEFCAIDDLSCLDSCDSEWIKAHCACDTGALFGSYSFNFKGHETYCCGDDNCQEAVSDMYISQGYDSSAVDVYLSDACKNVECGSYSFKYNSFSYSHGDFSFSYDSYSHGSYDKMSFSYDKMSFSFDKMSMSFSYGHSMSMQFSLPGLSYSLGDPSATPSEVPTQFPSTSPSAIPTASPSAIPTQFPSTSPSAIPTASPSAIPTTHPSPNPSTSPSSAPTSSPSFLPSSAPSVLPSPLPSATPTIKPSPQPSTTPAPTTDTPRPTTVPSQLPTALPSIKPSPSPTQHPSELPTGAPTPSPTETPQPGLIITGPSSHSLSEDGVTTSSFTTALSSEPLSTVKVNFSPQYGSYVISPTSVTYNYLNYTTATTFILTAIDNNIDQGDFYNDSVVIKVTSSDSYSECTNQGRAVCGQAALYSSLVVKKLNVTIADDDTAGVTLSSTSIGATYDNFGDPLTDGTYTMMLTSRPRFAVTIDLSGNGGYTSVSPASVTILPSAWQSAVTITVSADAASDNRPVCASGNRFCSDLDARTETITHSITSSDNQYKALSVASVVVGSEVVYDDTDPPRVSTGRFTNLLNGITITFDKDSNRGGFTGSFDCTNVLDLTTSEVKTYFGSGSYCSFSSDSSLKIIFGQKSTVVPGDEFIITDLVFQTTSSTASLFTMNETFIVGQPSSPTIPVIDLSASSTSVGVCDDLILDGSSSTGSGGRALTYNFSVAPGSPGASVANISEVFNLLNGQANGKGKFRATVPSADMPKGESMIFKLAATNFLGYTGVSTVTVKKLGVPAPLISVQGANPRTTLRSDALKLHATAGLPTMTCLSFDISNAKMDFIWTETTGAYSGSLVSTKNPRLLNIPADSLDALTTYTFQVVGFMTDTPNINNTATVDVEVLQQSLVAIITGGAFQQYGIDTSFVLYGDESTDPDASAVSFTYYWACAADTSTASCSGLSISSSSSSSLSVAAAALTVGEYTFTLSVFKGVRNDTTTCIVEIVNGAPPVITITAPTNAKYNTDEEYLSIVSSVSSSLSYSTTWTPSSSDIAKPFQQGGALKSSVNNKLTVVVALYLLTEGDTYTFQLSATDSAGETSYSTVSITMNEPPTSGSVSVTPINGFALYTAFTFSATNWVEDDLPVTYIFGTTALNTDLSADTTSLAPFGDERSDASYTDVTLTQGSNTTNYTVGCFAQVVDYYGAVAIDSTTIRVAYRELTVEQLANISATKTADSLDSNDGDASKQILKAALRGLRNTITSNGNNRRQLLGSRTGAAAAVRVTALADLWSTYAITTVTVSDVASLLSVLVGVVDVPAEVSYDVASGSQFFLHTILRASLGANIGISTASTDSVGDALTYLFQTPLFNATSYLDMNSQNISDSLRLTSAAQLYNAFDGVGYSLVKNDVTMYSYRTAASTILDTFSITIGGVVSTTGASNGTTSLYLNGSVATLASETSTSIIDTDLLDLRFYLLNFNIYGAFLKGTSGTPPAIASRLDQSGGDLTGITLLRSQLATVEVSEQDSYVPIDVTSSSLDIEITLTATYPFTTDFASFDRTFSCPTDGVVIDLNCTLTTATHTCDQATYGAGNPYYFTYVCPYVVPKCVYWDETTSDFESDDCLVVSGYTSTEVTCQCSRLGTFALTGNSTQPYFEAFTTPAPTGLPTYAPTPLPTSEPTPLPTYQPTPAPSVSLSPTAEATYPPTFVPTPLPTLTPSFAPTEADAVKLDLDLQMSGDGVCNLALNYSDAIRSEIAASISTKSGTPISADDITAYSVSGCGGSRRRRKLLAATKVVTVTMTFTTSLSDSSYETADGFYQAATSSLAAAKASITASFEASCGCTINVDTIQVSVSTRWSPLDTTYDDTPAPTPSTYYGGADCPNACSGHGSCSTNGCVCWAHWGDGDDTGGACDQRKCPYEIAWVDVPSSENKAHALRECAGRGICDRSTGDCQCFAGYGGVGCRRTTCPNDCSGHGTCEYMSEMRNDLGDNFKWTGNAPTRNQYDFEFPLLWDAHKTRGCVCDPKYTGLDCSIRMCPRGDYPMFFSLVKKAEVQAVVITNVFTPGTDGDDANGYKYSDMSDGNDENGEFALTFRSRLNEEFSTKTLNVYNLSEAIVEKALNSLPNKVVEEASVVLYRNLSKYNATTYDAGENKNYQQSVSYPYGKANPQYNYSWYDTDLVILISFEGSMNTGDQYALECKTAYCGAGCQPKLEHALDNKIGSECIVINDYEPGISSNWECSGRGTCGADGVCQCFEGFRDEYCSTKMAII